MAVRRKGNQYIIEFMFKGRRIFKRVPRAATKAQALEHEAALKREIFDTNVLNKQLKVTIREALDKWLESIEGRKAFKQTKSHALNAAQIVGAHSLGAIADSAEELRRASAVRGWKAGTLNRRLAVLKALAKFAWRKGWLQENLSGKIAQVREGPGRQTHLTREQIDALIKATPERSKAYVALAVYTGLRQGLVLSLTPESFSGGALQLPDSKGGIPLGIPLIPAAKPFLAALPFTLHKRTHYADFEKARKAIGMPNLWYHDLRHTTASLMAQAGVPLYTIGEILGHKSIQTTKRYAHLRLEDKRRALEEAFKDAA